MISYAVLLVLALVLNIRSRRMFALSVIVGADIFFPVPDYCFYPMCIAIEVLVALFAVYLSCEASTILVRISVLLVIIHITGWVFNGYPVESPYHYIVRFLEHAELLACIFLSPPIIRRWLNVF